MKKPRKDNRDKTRINHQIRSPKVRVISPEGEQLGVLSLREAIEAAEEHKLDLVEVAPEAKPPVCKILDYGKFKYEKSKREKQIKQNSKQVVTKTIKLTPNIGENDLQRKITKIGEFLGKGFRVQVEVRMKGRQNAHAGIAFDQIRKISETLEIQPESNPNRQGNRVMAAFQAKQEQ